MHTREFSCLPNKDMLSSLKHRDSVKALRYPLFVFFFLVVCLFVFFFLEDFIKACLLTNFFKVDYTFASGLYICKLI